MASAAWPWALARMFATRAAADYYRRSTGHLPANLEDVEV